MESQQSVDPPFRPSLSRMAPCSDLVAWERGFPVPLSLGGAGDPLLLHPTLPGLLQCGVISEGCAVHYKDKTISRAIGINISQPCRLGGTQDTRPTLAEKNGIQQTYSFGVELSLRLPPFLSLMIRSFPPKSKTVSVLFWNCTVSTLYPTVGMAWRNNV